MHITDIAPEDSALTTEVLPVLLHLRPHLTASSLQDIYAEGYPQGLRFTAAFDNGACVGIAGWRLVATTHVVRKLYIDDLVIDEQWRNRGVGKALLTELTQRARDADCHVLDLDSGVQRSGAHKFYMREGMSISSFHFALRL